MARPNYDIKNPTTRKARNRGFDPMTWHNADQIVSGWIFKTGRKWLYFFSPSTGRKRLPLSERINMRAI